MPQTTDKPLAQLQKLVRLLGWRYRLRLCQHVIGDDAPPEMRGETITWYECRRAESAKSDCFLQINEHPPGQVRKYNAAVFAIRYRICTGWLPFEISEDDEQLQQEANRLRVWLGFRWFNDPKRRRAFRLLHPDCAGYSWRKIQKA